MRKVYATRQKTIVSESASFTEKGKSKIESQKLVLNIMKYNYIIMDMTTRECILLLV